MNQTFEFIADVSSDNLSCFYDVIRRNVIKIKESSKDLGAFHFVLEGSQETYLNIESLNICKLSKIHD